MKGTGRWVAFLCTVLLRCLLYRDNVLKSENQLLIGPALDRPNGSLFPEERSKKQERNLHRIPSFCTAKYSLDDITPEKVTVNLFLP